jgi:hypothetical protein
MAQDALHKITVCFHRQRDQIVIALRDLTRDLMFRFTLSQLQLSADTSLSQAVRASHHMSARLIFGRQKTNQALRNAAL